MEKVIKILMERDGISHQEASRLVRETRSELMASSPFEAEEIMANNLGLEPDYIFDILQL